MPTSPLLASLLGLIPPEPVADDPPELLDVEPPEPQADLPDEVEPEPEDDAPPLDDAPAVFRRVLQPAPPRPAKRSKPALIAPPSDPLLRKAWTRRKLVRWLRQLADDDALPPLGLRLGIALGLRHVSGLSGEAMISEETLADELHVSAGRVRRAIKGLSSGGHLDVQRQRGEPPILRPILKARSYWRLDRVARASDPRPGRRPRRKEQYAEAGARGRR